MRQEKQLRGQTEVSCLINIQKFDSNNVEKHLWSETWAIKNMIPLSIVSEDEIQPL